MKHKRAHITTEQRLQALSPEARKLIEDMARLEGCQPEDFSVQQINNMIGQAESIGEL